MKKFVNKYSTYICVSLCAMIAYLLIYGYHILNPFYTDWLLGQGDLSQHYLGWQAFKNSPWMFPIGMTNQLAYPSSTSIIFTDSIPLLAVFFKLFKAVLPTEFQYFGFWGIACYILQGIFAVHIIQRFVKNKLYVILTSMLFVIAPVMIWRLYFHTALAGQWLVLFALDTFFSSKDEPKTRILTKWALIGALCSSVHLYLLLMSGFVLIGSCINNVIQTKRLKNSLFMLGAFFVPALIVIALLGGFSSGMSAPNSGLGTFSFNLNAFFNPQGWSRIFVDRSTYGGGQYEGFAYLGAGVILLLGISFIAVIKSHEIRNQFKANKSQMISIAIVFTIALLFSLSHIITFGGKKLLEIPLPNKIIYLWSIFRATGRISWIMVYLIMLGVVIISYRFMNRRSAILIAALVLCLQVYDIHEPLVLRNELFNKQIVYKTTINDSTLWSDISNQQKIRHIIFTIGFEELSPSAGWSIANWAMDNNMTLNDFYFARDNSKTYLMNLDASLADPDESDLFVFGKENALTTQKYDFHYYRVDDLIIGTTEPIEGYQSVDQREFATSRYTFGDNLVKNGADKDGSRYLESGGQSFGPYWELPKGDYKVEIVGSNLKGCDVSAYSSFGKMQHTISELVKTDDRIEFIVTIPEDASNFEIMVQNQSNEEVRLSYMQLSFVG